MLSATLVSLPPESVTGAKDDHVAPQVEPVRVASERSTLTPATPDSPSVALVETGTEWLAIDAFG